MPWGWGKLQRDQGEYRKNGPWDGIGRLGGHEGLRKSKLARGFQGKGWTNWWRSQVPVTGAPKAERRWLLWVGRGCEKLVENPGIREAKGKFSYCRSSVSRRKNGGPMVGHGDRETLGPFSELLKCYIYSKKKEAVTLSDSQQWAELYTSLDSLF